MCTSKYIFVCCVYTRLYIDIVESIQFLVCTKIVDSAIYSLQSHMHLAIRSRTSPRRVSGLVLSEMRLPPSFINTNRFHASSPIALIGAVARGGGAAYPVPYQQNLCSAIYHPSYTRYPLSVGYRSGGRGGWLSCNSRDPCSRDGICQKQD